MALVPISSLAREAVLNCLPVLLANCSNKYVLVRMLCISDLEAHAKQVLDRNAWGYYSSGADAQQTLADNQAAFSRYIS